MKRLAGKKLLIMGPLLAVFTLLTPGLASAHVVVSPNEALTGDYETFTTSVPNEKDIPVTAVRLVIPEGVESVTPTVKPGWQIETKKSGDNVTEISWTGGVIDAGLRDDFSFSAHMPSKGGDLNWKAYQTYQDGSIVSWDQKPSDDHGHDSEDESKGPYSITTVSAEPDTTDEQVNDSSDTAAYIIAVVALVLSALALIRTAKK